MSGNRSKKIISFVNQKGGVGKTTLVFNTAHALAQMGHKVLCLDLDPQGNLSSLFQCADHWKKLWGKTNPKGELSFEDDFDSSQYSIYQLLINSQKELKLHHRPLLLGQCLYTYNPKNYGKDQKDENFSIDFIPGHQFLSSFDLLISSINFPKPIILKKMIEDHRLHEIYDYILIDCPPTLGLLVVNAISASQGSIVPYRPCEFSLSGIKNSLGAMDDIREMGLNLNPEVIMMVPNLVETRRKVEHGLMLEIMEFIQGKEIQECKVNELGMALANKSILHRANQQKKSVFQFQSKEYHSLQEDFLKIGKVIQEWSQGLSS